MRKHTNTRPINECEILSPKYVINLLQIDPLYPNAIRTVVKKQNEKNRMYKLLEDPKVKSWRTLMEAHNKIYRYLESALLKNNCSIPRFQIFFYLYFYGPLSSSDLAQYLNVTRGNISTFVRRLEDDGLILVTVTKERGGKQQIELTEKGIANFEFFFPEHIKRVTSVMPELSKKTLQNLSEIKISD